jgi:hypothetical protein
LTQFHVEILTSEISTADPALVRLISIVTALDASLPNRQRALVQLQQTLNQALQSALDLGVGGQANRQSNSSPASVILPVQLLQVMWSSLMPLLNSPYETCSSCTQSIVLIA